MSTVELKKEIKKYIDKADQRTLKIVYAILEAEREDSDWESLPEAVKKSIDQGLKEADEGKTIPHEEVVKKYSKWFSK